MWITASKHSLRDRNTSNINLMTLIYLLPYLLPYCIFIHLSPYYIIIYHHMLLTCKQITETVQDKLSTHKALNQGDVKESLFAGGSPASRPGSFRWLCTAPVRGQEQSCLLASMWAGDHTQTPFHASQRWLRTPELANTDSVSPSFTQAHTH